MDILEEIMADDRLLDAIGAGRPVEETDGLTDLLIRWRREIVK